MTVLLRCLSHFSFLTGTLAPRELCALAARHDIAHLGLCDWGGLYGSPLFAAEAARVGIHALHGVVLGGGAGMVTLLARDEDGLRSLCRIVSDYRLAAAGGADRVAALVDLVAANRAGLFVLAERLALLERLCAVLGPEDLRVALPPQPGFDRLRAGEGPRCEDPSARAGRAGAAGATGPGSAGRPGAKPPADPFGDEVAADSRKVPDPPRPDPRHRLLAFADARGVVAVAAPLVAYGAPGDRARHRLATACKKGALLDLVGDRELAPHGSFFPSLAELRAGYADRPEALAEAERLALRCSLDLSRPRRIVFPSAAGALGGDPAEAEGRAAAVLRARAEAGFFRLFDAPERRPGSRPAEARHRLEQELGTIAELGFAPYFLVVDEIVQLARAHGIPVLGRGSAADSLVAYCLGFTDADPLRYRLCFERFLNAERFRRGEGDPLPDVDLDFCWRRRDELLGLVARRFGEDRVALLSTQPTLGFRAAWREAARTLGLPLDEVDRRARGLPRTLDPDTVAAGRAGDRAALEPILARAPGFRRRLEGAAGPEERRREARMLRGAFGLVGAHRCLGLHPGGTVLAPVPARDLMPLERAAKGLVCVQWDKHVAPRMGLVKIDLLGNRGLSIFEDAQRELLRLGVSLEAVEALRETPEEDPQAAELARAGRTLGVFQVESPGMRSLLTRVDARRCDDVIRTLALIRPGPAGCGMLDRYVQRVRGLEPVPALPPGLGPVLGENRGVMLYQEDVIHVLAALTGLTLGEADLLRRDLGRECRGLARGGRAWNAGAGPLRGRPEAELAEALALPETGPATARYLALCADRGLDGAVARAFWVQIARFGGYAFNKAHAVTYGRLAWRILRAKARQPAALFAAILANDTGYYDKRVYVEEARRLGVSLLAPCVNRSALRFRAERQGGTGAAALRVGLGEVKGLPEALCEALIADRDDRGPYFAVDELVARVEERGLTVEEDWVERLVLVGAFDLLEGTRPEKLWRFRVGFGRRRRRRAAMAEASGELFPGALERRAPIIPCLPEYSDEEKARLETELLGYPVRAHVISFAPPLADDDGSLPLSEVAARVGQSVQVLGWLAATRRHRTRGGEWMCFLTLEDAGGMVEAVLFPAVFRRCGHELAGQGRYRLRGRVELREGAVALHADMIERVDGE